MGGGDIVHFEAKVVQAGAVFREPCLQGMIGRERLDELEVGVAEVEVGEADRAAVDDFGSDDGEAKFVAPGLQRFLGGGNGNGEVIEALVMHLRKKGG